MYLDKGRLLNTKCDKNTIWPKLTLAVGLWCGCVYTDAVSPELMSAFRDRLLGYLVVAHDKGERIKLFTAYKRGEYTTSLLRKALDVTGIPVYSLNDDIRCITIYPSGDLKIEFKNRVEWT